MMSCAQIAVLVSILGLILASCGPTKQRALGPDEVKTFSLYPELIPQARKTRATRSKPETLAVEVFLQLKKEQKYHEAMKVARDELIDPTIYEDSYVADFAVLYINAMSELLVHEVGEPNRYDAEMKRTYRFAKEKGKHDLLRQVQLETMIALFYGNSRRNGLALPHIRKALEIYTKLKDQYQIINQHNSMAAAFSDMGEREIGGHYRDRALQLAESYFKVGISPVKPNEWLQYHKMIKARMDDLAGRPNSLATLERLWKRYEKIMLRYKIIPMSTSYKDAGIYFIRSGDRKRGQRLFAHGDKLSRSESKTLSSDNIRALNIDIQCRLMHFLAVQKKYREAVPSATKCWDGFIATKRDMGVSIPSYYGVVLEGVGRHREAVETYLTAINEFENSRGSFQISERAKFFDSEVARRPYWGLVRSRAQLATESTATGTLFDVVRASERMRARQFADRMNLADKNLLTNSSLTQFRKQLGPGIAVVSYVLTDTSVLIVAMTRNKHRVILKDYDKGRFDAMVRKIAGDLATPDSDLRRLQRDLVNISKVLIAPLGGMVSKAEKIIVVPDGIMSVLPYNVLSTSGERYRPIIDRSSVTMSPSFLQMLSDTETVDLKGEPRIFAVADPSFDTEYKVPGLSRNQLREIAVTSNIQQYFAPLPETRDEVVAISRLFEAKHANILMGSRATETEIKRQDLENYRYLHFATHGVVGGDLPGLQEPALVFGKDAINDGFLTISETQNFKLAADLTVLSACKTGAGEVVAGEGVMGMGRAFLLAGSRRVIMSLWSVASKETEVLMVGFYNKMLSGGENSVSRSFRATALSLRKKRPHPFYWSPFIVVGADLS